MDKYLRIWEPVLRNFESTYEDMCISRGRKDIATVVDWYPSGYAEITVTMSDGLMYVFNTIGSCITPVQNKQDIDDHYNEISTNEDTWRKNFSKRLVIKMRRQGISQDRLSQRSGISIVTLSRYMNGLATPSGFNLQRLSRALGCSVTELTSISWKGEN